MASDQGRETDRWVEVRPRDAEEGPCGDNERNTERKRLSETTTIVVISQGSCQPKKMLAFARLFSNVHVDGECDSEIKARLFMPVCQLTLVRLLRG